MLKKTAILSVSDRSRLATSEGLSRANEMLHRAAFQCSPLLSECRHMRCVQCHLANGFFPANHMVKPHKHTEFQIEIVVEGVFDFQIGREVFSLHPGDALAVASQTEHAWRTKKGGIMLGILLDGSKTADQSLRQVAPGGGARFSLPGLQEFVGGLIHESLTIKPAPFHGAQVTAWLTLVIAEIFNAFHTHPPSNSEARQVSTRSRDAVDRACSFIAANIRHPMAAEEIASQVGLSVRHLRRAFSEHRNTSLQQYISECRLTLAMQMMEKSNSFQIKEIAYECGFSSPSHFTMSFRKKFHTSPTAFASLQH